MSGTNYVPGHELQAIDPGAGVEFLGQHITPQADGTTAVTALKSDPVSTAGPNPSLTPREITALTYAFKRFMMQMSPQPSRNRSRVGLGWRAGPVRASNNTMNHLSQINPHNPTRTLMPLLRLFHGLERDGTSLNFIRKDDLNVIHNLQYKHNIRRSVPTLSPAARRRAMRPGHYKALTTAPTKRFEQVFFHGKQAEAVQRAAMPSDLKFAPRVRRAPEPAAFRPTGNYRTLNRELRALKMKGPSPQAATAKKRLDQPLKPAPRRRVKPQPGFAAPAPR